MTDDKLFEISDTIYNNLCVGSTNITTSSRSVQTEPSPNVVDQSIQTNPPRKRSVSPITPSMKPVRKKYVSKYLENAQDTLQNKSIVPCKNGKSHSVDTSKTMIFGVNTVLVQFQVTFTATCGFMSKLIGTDINQVRDHCNRWFKEGSIQTTDNSHRGTGSDRYGTDQHILKSEHLHHIVKYVDHMNVHQGDMVGVKEIQSSLLHKFGRNYKRTSLYYELKVRLGYVYKKPKDLRVTMSSKRKSQLLKH